MSTIQDALKALKRGVKDDGESYRLRDAVIDAVVELEADNARLRALVEALKPPASGRGMWLGRCPWCHAAWSPTPGYRTYEEGNENEPHAGDCPAFTPDGTVK